jgi:ribonuclease HI
VHHFFPVHLSGEIIVHAFKPKKRKATKVGKFEALLVATDEQAQDNSPGPAAHAWELSEDDDNIVDRDAEAIDSYESDENEAYAVGVFRIIEATPGGSSVHIFTPSDYVVTTICIHRINWKKNGWLKSDGKPPAYVDWWKRVDEYCAKHCIEISAQRLPKSSPDFKERFHLLEAIAVETRNQQGRKLGSPRSGFGPIDDEPPNY